MFGRVKDNVKNAGGARLNNNFELFTIGFHSTEGTRSMDHFNFGPNEPRGNVVYASAVTAKLKHSGDDKTVNVYQKPRALLDWMVTHFSFPRDWVMDLCSGSGTGLASSLALGRHCVAVEADPRQCSVLKGRVLSLSAQISGDTGKSLEVGDDEEPASSLALVPVVVPGSSVAGPSTSAQDFVGQESQVVRTTTEVGTSSQIVDPPQGSQAGSGSAL
jgi:hypothetical protein